MTARRERDGLNYYQTLIAVADDCPVAQSQIPPERNGKQTIASLQFALIHDHPSVYTQEDILFQTWLLRQEERDRSDAEVAQLRERFFSKSQACLRSSPLPKRYGWGLLFDEDGRVKLCPVESDEYKRITAGEASDIKVVKAMRTKRA